jgi:hypothetical protein
MRAGNDPIGSAIPGGLPWAESASLAHSEMLLFFADTEESVLFFALTLEFFTPLSTLFLSFVLISFRTSISAHKMEISHFSEQPGELPSNCWKLLILRTGDHLYKSLYPLADVTDHRNFCQPRTVRRHTEGVS